MPEALPLASLSQTPALPLCATLPFLAFTFVATLRLRLSLFLLHPCLWAFPLSDLRLSPLLVPCILPILDVLQLQPAVWPGAHGLQTAVVAHSSPHTACSS
jgi:hypothetical protein